MDNDDGTVIGSVKRRRWVLSVKERGRRLQYNSVSHEDTYIVLRDKHYSTRPFGRDHKRTRAQTQRRYDDTLDWTKSHEAHTACELG
jgi:hypothetical protein